MKAVSSASCTNLRVSDHDCATRGRNEAGEELNAHVPGGGGWWAWWGLLLLLMLAAAAVHDELRHLHHGLGPLEVRRQGEGERNGGCKVQLW